MVRPRNEIKSDYIKRKELMEKPVGELIQTLMDENRVLKISRQEYKRKMKPEPLKDKDCWDSEDLYKNKFPYYSEEDIKLAIKWLRNKRKYFLTTYNDHKNFDIYLNKAFEDVMEE